MCFAVCALCTFAAPTTPAAGGADVQGPIVSPCLRCAGTACCDTVIVTNGFFAEWVWWQIVTFPDGYWASVGEVCENETSPAAYPVAASDANAAAARTATVAAAARVRRDFLSFSMGGPPRVEGLT